MSYATGSQRLYEPPGTPARARKVSSTNSSQTLPGPGGPPGNPTMGSYVSARRLRSLAGVRPGTRARLRVFVFLAIIAGAGWYIYHRREGRGSVAPGFGDEGFGAGIWDEVGAVEKWWKGGDLDSSSPGSAEGAIPWKPNRAPPPPSGKATKIEDVSVRPDWSAGRRRPYEGPEEKFMGYYTHSGYHNQRISLENALTLAYMLNRTLIVPPVWLGSAIPYISTSKLQDRLASANKQGLERCGSSNTRSRGGSLSRECIGYFEETQVSWSYLVDATRFAEAGTPIIERWDMTDAWLTDKLGLSVKRANDVKVWEDAKLYQYRFYDKGRTDGKVSEGDELGKFTTKVDVEQLAKETKDIRFLQFGTMFGTTRLRVKEEDNWAARKRFRSTMVFKNDVLDRVVDAMRDLLGGSEAYFAAHMRLGDGVFAAKAPENSRNLFTKLARQAGASQRTIDAMLAKYGAAGDGKEWQAKWGTTKRSNINAKNETSSGLDSRVEEPDARIVELATRAEDDYLHDRDEDPTHPATPSLHRRGADPPFIGRPGLQTEPGPGPGQDPLPPLPTIRTIADSPLSPHLKCARPLHTAPDLLPLNYPLYIATDSKIPRNDANLRIFFEAFPCAFVLNDFSHVEAAFGGLRNQDDKVLLAQFFYPIVDAMVASKARALVVTPGSTFSRFTADILHQFFHGWPTIDRG